MNRFNFFVGIIHILHILHKPGIAQCMRVRQRKRLSALQREDVILGVQHVQNRELGSINLFHISFGFRYCLKQGRHFSRDMFFNHFLITAQLGCMVTAHTLVPIGCIVLVEGIRSQVQHAIVQRLVGQNHLVRFGRLETLCLHLLFHKLVVIQIALVDWPHIHQAKQSQCTYQYGLFQLSGCIHPKQNRTCRYNEETAPCISSEKAHADFFQVCQQRHQLVCRE